MPFAEAIAADYQSHVELTWDYHSDVLTASFTLPDVAIVKVQFDRKGESWDVGFDVEQLARDARLAHSAFRIFNGVFQAVQEFITVREPASIIFVAKGEDLAGIYKTYLARHAETLQQLGYQIEGPVYIDPYVEWILTRQRASSWMEN